MDGRWMGCGWDVHSLGLTHEQDLMTAPSSSFNVPQAPSVLSNLPQTSSLKLSEAPRWMGGGWEVDGRWMGCGWDVDGRWMGGG